MLRLTSSLLGRIGLLTLVTGVVVASPLACSSDDGTEAEPNADGGADASTAPRGDITYEVFPWTKDLTAETKQAVTNVSTQDGSITFAGTPAQLAGLQPGDVLVSGASATIPDGLLRQVVEVKNEGGNTVLMTKPVPIQLAFKSLHIRAVSQATMLDGASPAAAAEALGQVQTQGRYSTSKGAKGGKDIDWRVFDLDKDRTTKDNQLYVTGNVHGELTLTTYVDLDWLDEPSAIADQVKCALKFPFCTPKLPDVKLGIIAKAAAGVSIDAEGAARKGYDSDEFPIDGTAFDLPVIELGPVRIYPSIDFVAAISGDATSRFHAKAGLEYSASTEASIGLVSGPAFVPPTFEKTFTPPTVEVALGTSLKASVGPRVKLLFWKTFGPTVSVMGYGNLHADTAKTPCWGVDVGADLRIGLALRIPWDLLDAESLGNALGLSGDIFHKTFGPFQLFEIPNVVTGACGKLPANVYPPGEGPSEDVYKAPTFTPWSKRYVDDTTNFYQYPYSSEAHQSRIHTDTAIDGGWLLSGKGIYGLAKIDETGALLWAKNVRLLEDLDFEGEIERPATVAAQAKSTNVWVATKRFTVGQVDQDGDLVWAKRYSPDVPDSDPNAATVRALGEDLDAVALQSLPDGGALVVYAVQETPKDGPAVLLRLDAGGGVVWSKTFKYETAKTFAPVLVPVDGDFLVAGSSWESGSNHAYVSRIKGDGSLGYAKKLGVCGNARVQPGQGIRIASGAIALTGSYDLAPERSFLVQFPADASTIGGTVWNSGSGVTDLVSNSVVQLPITGFLTSAGVVPVTGSQIRLTQHDGIGQIVDGKEREYSIDRGAGPYDTQSGAIRLTLDGGLLVFGHSDKGLADHGLWVSKIPANSLDADFSGTGVGKTTPQSVPSECGATVASFTDDPSFALAPFPVRIKEVGKKFSIVARTPKVESILPK